MNRALFERVRLRAKGHCEYCLIGYRGYRLPHQIDHILAKQHGGATELDNLALACFHCNRFKGPNIFVIYFHSSAFTQEELGVQAILI